jgi:diguanylate cyclase (GGDEF)-like protein
MGVRERRLLITWPRLQPSQAITWLVSLSVAITLGLLALGAGVLLDARADAWVQARNASDNLAVTLGRDIGRNIELFDLSLQGVILALQRPDINQVSPEMRQLAMFGRAAAAEYMGTLVLTDAAGTMIANSTTLTPPPVSLAGRDYFLLQKERSDVGLSISRPFASRQRDGDPSIAITRRVSDRDGQFAGVAIATLRLAYFNDRFAKLNLGATASITLFRDDGRVLMRRPYRAQDIDADLSGQSTFRHMREGRSGSFFGTAALDGVTRFYTYRRIGDLPLILSIAIGVDEVYAAWTRKAISIGAVLTLLCCTMIALCLLFRAELLRRTKAEAALREAAEQLEIMATTDGLTGLRNRRAFEDALHREWLRAKRNQTPIAVLMADADWFKFFNDRYGHPAGDQVLQRIADCIMGSAVRPADVGARYGGEEFIVLLPDTDRAGAASVADRIRGRFEALDIRHDGSPYGKTTMSIGVAVDYPAPGEAAASLIQRADRALYQAKGFGRNKVVVADGDDLTEGPPPVAALVTDANDPWA